MKTPRILIAALVSGRVKLTPTVLEAMKRLDQQEQNTESNASNESSPPQPPAPDASDDPTRASVSPSCRSRHRMILVSPLPGRWVRRCG
jgi:hypothetical protein